MFERENQYHYVCCRIRTVIPYDTQRDLFVIAEFVILIMHRRRRRTT